MRPHSNAGPTATIFGGLLLLGIGRTMPFSLGLPLVDDNVRKANLPLYFGWLKWQKPQFYDTCSWHVFHPPSRASHWTDAWLGVQ